MRLLRTFPALARVTLPRSAQIVAVHPRLDAPGQAPALVTLCDDADGETVERGFIEVHPLGAVPPGAVFLSSWRQRPRNLAERVGAIVCLFEVPVALPDAARDLPDDALQAFMTLTGEGFELRSDKAWLAPDDCPPGGLSAEQIIAIATLQDHGFGSVVNA